MGAHDEEDTVEPSSPSKIGAPGLALTGFDGKVAVVTGAGRRRSIGRSIALVLAQAGCDVVITGSGRDPSTFPEDEQAVGWRDVESVADEIRQLGRTATTAICDIANPEHVDHLVNTVREVHGRVDIVVNNAAAAKGEDRNTVVDVDPSVWRRVIEVNLIGTFQMSQAFGRMMLESGAGGSLVNISSIAGKVMEPKGSAYCASKAAVHAMTGCMAAEMGPHNIRVNAIAPGVIDTSRLDADHNSAQWDQWLTNFIPLGRAGSGDDVANAVAFLCSDQGSWITGQTYLVDGGSIRQH
jgi:NAD(P)-dependent dehydrogenase (short-subunit alcohol dehydrogenase family)